MIYTLSVLPPPPSHCTHIVTFTLCFSSTGPFGKKHTKLDLRLTAFFAQKTLFLGYFLQDFFLTESWGTPLPPLTDSPLPKS